MNRRIDRPDEDFDDVVPEAEGVVPSPGRFHVADLAPEVLGEVHTSDPLIEARIVPACMRPTNQADSSRGTFHGGSSGLQTVGSCYCCVSMRRFYSSL